MISIACAIVHSPPVLILDGATPGLDVYSRRLVIDTVCHMNHEGSTILLTTHTINEANALCTTISVINKGKIVATASPSEDSFILSVHKHWIDTAMTAIPRKYITDAKNQKQAVIVDLETFKRMESIIEDNGLAKFMDEAEEDETLSVREAKKHYRSLKKA